MMKPYRREHFRISADDEDMAQLDRILDKEPDSLTEEERKAVARMSVAPFVSLTELVTFLWDGADRIEQKEALDEILDRMKEIEADYLQIIGPDYASRHPATS